MYILLKRCGVKSKMKKISQIILSLSVILLLTLSLAVAGRADAGSFSGDSDWGGSSDWGSSDWGSSDWGDSDSDWSWSSGSSSGSYSDSYDDDSDLGCLGSSVVWIVVIVIVIIVISRMNKGSKQGAQVYQASQETPGISLDILREKDPDFNEQKLLEQVGNMYVQMQNAWQNNDWEPMRAIMTDSLYNQMARQLKELKSQGVTNRIDRIAVLDSSIRRYAIEGDNDVLTIRLATRICDYYTNDQSGQVVRGDPNKELFMTYDWKMIRQKDQKTQQEGVMTEVSCPNCGAPISIKQSGKCPYCDSVITLSDHDWVLSSIKGISQRSN